MRVSVVKDLLHKLDTMNRPIEDVFMDYINDSGTLPISEAAEGVGFPQWPVDFGLEWWEERDYLSLNLLGLDGPVIGLESGCVSDVVAIDSSVVRVAESRAGPIVGLRAAVVHRSKGVSVKVIGPFLRLIRPVSLQSVGHEIREELRYFERLVQLWALSNIQGGIYLFDGTLMAGFDRSGQLLQSILDMAERAGGTILAFSKESLLARGGIESQPKDDGLVPPYVHDLTEAAMYMWSGLRCVGGVFLTRLAPSLYPFRVDAYPRDRGLDALSSLLSSDALIHGYPETLILAHAHATFSWMDVVAMRGALLGHSNPAMSSILSPRLTVLTPFETRSHENPS
ncbi:MAG: DNA double-strand break repair nuclease NurA [Nitrososphaerota archaeon]